MKEFSPAGMAVKAFFGGPGWLAGGAAAPDRAGWQVPRTLGNPGGARAGDGSFNGGGGGGFTPVTFHIGIGVDSTGPLLGFGYNSDGTGYYTDQLNGHITNCGSITPAVVLVGGGQVTFVGWGGSAPYSSKFFGIGINATLPQHLFGSVSLGAPVGLVFATASASDYSTTDYPGFTIWTWADLHEYDFIGANPLVTLA